MTHVNTNVPNGLNPVRDGGSGYYTGGVNRYRIPATDATAMAKGDPVVITGDADGRGYADIKAVLPGETAMTGVLTGFEPIPSREQPNHRLASTERYALVADDASYECLIQANGVVTPDMIGQNVDFAVGPVRANYGQSGYQADVATVGAADTLPMQITGIFDAPDNQLTNEVGAAITNVTLKVRLNNSNRVDNEEGA